MTLSDALLLSIPAKELGALASVSERQIRKMRSDPKKPRPPIELDDAILAELVRKNEESDAKIKARDAWYLAEKHLLEVLQLAISHFDRIKRMPEATLALVEVKAQIDQELTLYSKSIQEALKLRTDVIHEANRQGIKAIWNTNEDEITKLLGQYKVHMQSQEKPSEVMRKRIKERLASDAA